MTPVRLCVLVTAVSPAEKAESETPENANAAQRQGQFTRTRGLYTSDGAA